MQPLSIERDVRRNGIRMDCVFEGTAFDAAREQAAAFWNETFSDRRADGNACGTGDGLLPRTGIAGNRKLPSGAAGQSERT